jgi:membrane-bound serine protease (ClpP class)
VESYARAYHLGLAQMRGRNGEWADKAETEAASLSAEEALLENDNDLMADDVPDLLTKLNGREIVVAGMPRLLVTAGLGVTPLEADWRTKLLSVITNPNVAYILMLIGIYGLLFEFYSPGLVGPGVIGGICLLLALYAFHVLPVDYTGLALTLLGVALMVAEAFLPSFGILGIGGIAAFVIGSIMLMDSDVPGFTIAWQLIGSIALVAGGLLMLVVSLLARSRRRAVVSGPEDMIDDIGPVLDWTGNEGRVRIHGEIWRARFDGTVSPGQDVRVVGIDGLTLEVEPDNHRR